MITIHNYFEITRDVDFGKLPSALQNGDRLTKGAAPNNWSAYNSNENIKRVVDAYMQKLDEYLKKNSDSVKTSADSMPVKPKKEIKAKKKVEAKVKAEVEPSATKIKNYKGNKVEIRPFSKRSTKFIVWDIKSDQIFANEKFDSFDEAKKFIEDNEMILVQPRKKTGENNATPVERIDIEVQFIKRYVGVNGKVKTQSEILRFLNALQKAILDKKIRKTSTYANEINHIQEQLVTCYNNMAESAKIDIKKETLEKFQNIAESQKSMLSVAYIRQYISLHGKKDVKEKAKILMGKMKKAVEKNKINKNDPYAERLNNLFQSLNNYIQGKTTTPVITKSELNGLMGIAGVNLFSKKKA